MVPAGKRLARAYEVDNRVFIAGGRDAHPEQQEGHVSLSFVSPNISKDTRRSLSGRVNLKYSNSVAGFLAPTT